MDRVPTMMPTNSASAMSRSVPAPSSPAPMNRIEPTGRMPTTEVVMDRTSVWFTARFTFSTKERSGSSSAPIVFSRILSKTTTVS